MKMILNDAAMPSANTADHHIPSIFQKSGSMNTNAAWSITVRMNEMSAEISPLFIAVKSAEPKIPIPQKRNDTEYIENACMVSSSSSAS